jgi:hypothetical protein
MNHLTEQDLVGAYYQELPDAGRQHLADCSECRAELERISELLDEVRSASVPPRNANYGREVWARLQSQLPAPRPWWRRTWLVTPAAVAVLAVTFIAGMLTMRNQRSSHDYGISVANQAGLSDLGLSEKDRQRVFLGAMSDHLERSEVLLAELVHTGSAGENVNQERSHARDLLNENRLLREAALRSGDQAHAALLDDLERVFLDLANSPGKLSSEDIVELGRRITDQGLLFKVRVTKTDARPKGPIS